MDYRDLESDICDVDGASDGLFNDDLSGSTQKLTGEVQSSESSEDELEVAGKALVL